MDANAVGVLVAVVGFAIAFGVAKLVSTRIRKRRQTRDDALAKSQQSRQVRRAQARRNQG
jgi:predicted amino acid dehydrogenase